MNTRALVTLLAAGAIVIGVAIGVAIAATNTSSTPAEEGPPPIAGITNQAVAGVPDAALERSARAYFGSLLERQYRGRAVPIKSATAAWASHLEAVPAAGRRDIHPEIRTVRYAQQPDGVREVTVQIDQGLADGTTQPLAADFREIDGSWLAVGAPTLDGDTHSDEPAAPPHSTPPAATRASRAYALAARSWTPDTLRSQYEAQLRLSVGELRRALEQSPPTPGLVDAYRDGGEHAEAEIRDIQTVRLTPTEITFSIVLAERTTISGAAQAQRTVNTATLERHDGRWLVAGFTVSS
jgi:hypothetical protein